MSRKSSNTAIRLGRRGAKAFDKYRRTGDPEALDAAATAWRDAVIAIPPSDPNLAWMLSDLGVCLRTRFELAGHATDLDAAVEAGRLAADIVPPGHPDLVAMLTTLGNSLRARFELTGNAADLDAAVDAGRRAVDLTPPGHPELAMYLSNLGSSLCARFELTGDAADLSAAVDAGQQAIDLTPPGHPHPAGRFSNLGNSLRARFELTGNAADLDAAVDAGRRAVDLTPPGHPELAMYLSNLGSSLHARFELAGSAADLDAAVDAGQQAVDLTPPGHPNLAGMLSNLGVALLTRFTLTGNTADLNTAVNAGQQAIDLTPPGHPNLAMFLGNLGNSLGTRFEQAGSPADLDAAIDVGRRAVDLTPPDDPHLAGRLSNLWASLDARFERAGDPADLDAAIQAEQQATDLTPPGHPNLAMYLSNLGGSLNSQFKLTGNPADIDAAIDAGRRAVELTPPGHPNLAMYLSNLGNSLLTAFEWAGDPADLDAAIDAGRRAVELTPPRHPKLAMYLSNLGGSLNPQFGRAEDPADLDAAIDAGRRAVELTPPGQPNLAGMLANLGVRLRARFERAGDPADLNAAIRCGQRANEVPAATPSVRLAAARMWGAAAADARRTRDAAEGHAVAVGLLPVVAWHGLDRATREDQLARWAELAADAAACAVLDDRPELAVELLEQGRSVLWTQALNLRSDDDITRLRRKAPDLARRLDSIRAILDSPAPRVRPALSEQAATSGPRLGHSRQQQDTAELRKRKAQEWDEVLAKVRALPGFGHFLAPVPYPDLAAAAVDGPTAIVNASRYGCHALIVDAQNERPRVVGLPDLSRDAAADHAHWMLQALKGAASPGRAFLDREKDRHAILGVLDWLWDVIAEPVLTALGHTSTPKTGSLWPRVWWCPTGTLSLLPIHAAGHYPRQRTAAGSSTGCVPDRVISSYTPTLAALARARQPVPATPVRQLTVGMPDTPGQRALPAVPAELKVLASHFPPGAHNHVFTGPQATHANVLTAIAAHSWVHLACHADQRHSDPADSGFALWDGLLTITDLATQPTKHRDLAFLSACQTAAGADRHLDEAIHLAAAMQFLGYRHVIATMWTIADSPAPHVAGTFYTALKPHDQPGGQPDPSRAAEALHHAIRSLRQIDPTNPLLWAPYIHLGS